VKPGQLIAPVLRQRRGEAVEKAAASIAAMADQDAFAGLVEAQAENARLRSALLLLLAEWHQEAEEYREAVGDDGDSAAPSYASGLISAWDDLRDALGVAV
jgi:hypothetical protein